MAGWLSFSSLASKLEASPSSLNNFLINIQFSRYSINTAWLGAECFGLEIKLSETRSLLEQRANESRSICDDKDAQSLPPRVELNSSSWLIGKPLEIANERLSSQRFSVAHRFDSHQAPMIFFVSTFFCDVNSFASLPKQLAFFSAR